MYICTCSCDMHSIQYIGSVKIQNINMKHKSIDQLHLLRVCMSNYRKFKGETSTDFSKSNVKNARRDGEYLAYLDYLGSFAWSGLSFSFFGYTWHKPS